MLTQFKPSARKGDEALSCWFEFMKFVDNILTTCEVHKYIVTDKAKQLNHQEMICELGGKPVIENKMVNRIMAQLIGIDGEVTKDELRQYQDQTTIDLLEAREYLMSRFEVIFEATQSHSETYKTLLAMATRKYPKSALA